MQRDYRLEVTSKDGITVTYHFEWLAQLLDMVVAYRLVDEQTIFKAYKKIWTELSLKEGI